MGFAGVKSGRNEAAMKQLNLTMEIMEYLFITKPFFTMLAMIQDLQWYLNIDLPDTLAIL
ncbi:MAG: hypothetical protein ACE5GV_01990 [Candidatus Scalindua sp.]